MADKKWLGVAVPVKQVQTFTIDTFDAATNYEVTINGDVISVLGDSDINTTAVLLKSQLDASTNPYFAAITWTSGGNTITATSALAGNPFVFTTSVSGGTGTISGITTVTASSGPNDWSVAKNWDTGTVPVNGDDVIIENSTVPITHGLDQSAVTLASLIIKLSYTGRIGLKEREFATTPDGLTTINTKVEYRDQYLKIGATVLEIGENFSNKSQAGSTLIKIDLGSVLSAVVIHQTGSSSFESKLPAIQLLGTNASNNMQVRSARASVGIAVHGFEVSTFLDIDIGSNVSGGGIILGLGVTLTNWSQKSGRHFIEAAGTITKISILGGTLTTEGDFTITTVDIGEGATYFANHIKTAGNAITTLNFLGISIVDTTRNSEARTFVTVNLFSEATLKADKSFLSVTNLLPPSGPYEITLE